MIKLIADNEFEAYKDIFISLYSNKDIPSDEELLREDSLLLEINNDIVSSRMEIIDDKFTTNFNYGEFIVDGVNFAQFECDYWSNELFKSNKVINSINYLKEFQFSKRAIMQIWQEGYSDLNNKASSVTYVFFRINKSKLNMNVHMRANDAYRCTLIDLDTMRAVQQYIANNLQLGIGKFIYFVDSLHLYKEFEQPINDLYRKLDS